MFDGLGVWAIIGVVALAIIFTILGPLIIALSLGILFALPFWPCFWLAIGVGMVISAGTSKG